jgi:O-antigen ligase
VQAIEKLLERAASDWRIAVASVAAVVLVIAYITFITYASITNGVMAGVGVLVSWPILLAVLLVVAAPFWLAGQFAAPPLRRRLSTRMTPAVAGAQDEPRTITDTTFPC